MTNTTTLTRQDAAEKLEKALIAGDLSALSPAEKIEYYRRTCESLGLNPYTRPFEYVRLGNREVLYAKRDATDQLRRIHNVSVTIVDRREIGDIYVVTARATMPDGRTDESIGAVTIAGLKGDALANALMKAETKAKRRVTLSICGLGWLDETELETIPAARSAQHVEPATGEITPPSLPPSTNPDRWNRLAQRYAELCDEAERLGVACEPLDHEWTEETLTAKGKTLAARIKQAGAERPVHQEDADVATI